MHREGAGTYSQLQAEGHPQHLKPLHLEIHSDGRLVVLVEGVFAKAGGREGGAVSSPWLPKIPPMGGQCPPPRGSAQHQSPIGVELSPRCCCPLVGGESVSPCPPPRPSLRQGTSRYRLIRQVFPTERSPTTMILEILNLQGRGTHGRSAAWRGPCLPPPSRPPRQAGSQRGGESPRSPPCPAAPCKPGFPTLPSATAQPGPPCRPPPAPHSCAVTQGSAHGQRRQPRGACVGDPPPGAGGTVGTLSPPPILDWGPQIAPDSPHGACPLFLAGAGHRGVEGGAGVQGGLLPKTLFGGGQRGTPL